MDKNNLMQRTAREAHEKGGFNGTWLYAEKGEIVSRGALGWRDPDGTHPILEDTIFQLASVSKQFTATAVMLLIREGKLSLEDRIVEFFPELNAYSGVTIRHLLTHTGGVPDYFDDSDWFYNIWNNEHRVPGNSEIVRFLCESKVKPLFAPGEKFEYSNTGYNLLAETVERLSGVPYEEFLQKRVFEPAGMTSTRCCHIRRDGAPFENYARATVFEDGRFVYDIDSKTYGNVTAFDGLNGDDYVYTNIFDMLKWDRVLREGSLLTKEEQALMYTPAILNNGESYADEEGEGYGFGWGVRTDEKLGLIVSHSGGMPGVSTWFERYIVEDRTLVMLFNRDPYDYRAGTGAWDGLQDIAYGKEPEPIKTLEDITLKDPDKSKWESFCGKYEHPEDDDFVVDEVYMKDGELYAKAFNDDGFELNFRLYPIGENEFGRKGGMVKLTFADGCLKYIENTCKKL